MAISLLIACQPKTESIEKPCIEADSVCFVFDQERIVCKINVETPDSSLRQAVGEWVDEQLGGYNTEDVCDMTGMVDFYGKAWVDTLRKALIDIRPDAVVEYEAQMKKAYETDKIVTYTFTSYLGLGGAHPSSSETGATFRKSDGKRLSWDIVRHELDYLFYDVKKDVIKAYFDCQTDEQLELMIDNIFDIPNPNTPPIFLQDGIMLIYQQYEIAGYAAGMPGGTVSYKKMKPLMTGQAKQLLPQ